jgi:membrane associated rhomboid family serine protease
MIPLRDDQPRFSTPFLTYFLIGLNLLIYLFESVLAYPSQRALVYQMGLIPANVTALVSVPGHVNPAAALLPFFTSMFLHGSWMHVIGNMWFLWIFGDNVEDYLGHFKYLVFYLLTGLAAALAQVALTPFSRVPTIGASGAIAGILGAYFILYPRARVLMWFPIIFFFHLPAWIVLGYWFLLQFLGGAASFATASNSTGGIAFWAHVGGFIAGLAMIKAFAERPHRRRYGTW